MAEPINENGVVLTEAQKQARRRRNIALALVIGGLCALFYLITVFKMGAGIMKRPL
jgi:hypothetical protein